MSNFSVSENEGNTKANDGNNGKVAVPLKSALKKKNADIASVIPVAVNVQVKVNDRVVDDCEDDDGEDDAGGVGIGIGIGKKLKRKSSSNNSLAFNTNHIILKPIPISSSNNLNHNSSASTTSILSIDNNIINNSSDANELEWRQKMDKIRHTRIHQQLRKWHRIAYLRSKERETLLTGPDKKQKHVVEALMTRMTIEIPRTVHITLVSDSYPIVLRICHLYGEKLGWEHESTLMAIERLKDLAAILDIQPPELPPKNSTFLSKLFSYITSF